MKGMIEGPQGWLLTPEAAAVFTAEHTAVIADVHLGYEWARAQGGDCLPAHSLRETLALFESLLARTTITRLIVAGDLVESRIPCPRTARDLSTLTRWLNERGVELIALQGNHDPPRRPPLASSRNVGGWTISHGHRPLVADRNVSGHHHPMLRASGVSAPCFLVDDATIILPAFSPNAAGVSLASLGPALAHSHPERTLRCIASAGGTLLDFGPIPNLLRNARLVVT